jgi:hypothetical protein
MPDPSLESCPIAGRKWTSSALRRKDGVVVEPELVASVVRSTGLTPTEAARVISDVVDFYTESAPDFVRRRHAQLQLLGMKNPEIFAQVRDELATRVVAPPPLTERQLRRLVYG